MFSKFYKRLINQADRFLYLYKRHFLSQLLSGRWKKIFHYLKVFFSNLFFNYPRLAIIETSTTCNLNCATCPTPRHRLGRPPTIMGLGQFKSIIDHIKDTVHVVLLYHTNEPLLNPFLSEMIRYCDQNHLYTMISTNAVLLDKGATDRLLNSGLDEIILCLDGMTKEAYETFRTGADFDVVKENIKYFCAEKLRRGLIKPFVELQFIVTKLNQDQIPLIRQFARENSVDRLRIKTLSIGEYAYDAQKRKELMDKFLPTSINVKSKYINDANSIRSKTFVARCSLVRNQIAVLSTGQLSLCCYDISGSYDLGNLLHHDLKDILSRPSVVKLRQEAFKRELALCKKCDIF